VASGDAPAVRARGLQLPTVLGGELLAVDHGEGRGAGVGGRLRGDAEDTVDGCRDRLLG
jgi:hypothetical protein